MTAERLVDAVGTEHRPATGPVRIVSLVPSLTELLFDLGLGARVVGRTGFCIHPAPAVHAVPRIGGTKTVRIERLRALAPTHVLVNVDENRIEDVEAMRAFVPSVVVTHPIEPADNVGLYELLGGLFGAHEAARALRERFERGYARLRRAAAALPRRRVLYLVWRDPWMTVSRDTYISRTLALVRWETIGHDEAVRYPRIGIDRRLAGRADLVLLGTEPFPFKPAHVDEVRALVGDADGAPRVRLIDAEMVSWYGSRAIAGLDYLADFAAGLDGSRDSSA